MANAFFKRRPLANTKVIVEIIGTGDSAYCYATIGGTKYYAAASGIEVLPGDVITFAVYGASTTYYGAVTVDGTQVAKSTNKKMATYELTVPEGVDRINIAITFNSSSWSRNGRITVTTS